MKRPLLAASLFAAFAGMIAYGTHYGPERALHNGLERFRASLPPGSSFTYSTARPDLLARGAHFTDVTLQVHDVTYRAHELHLGHVTLSSAGEISFSRLDLDHPSLEAPNYQGQATLLHLRGLVIPPDHGEGMNAIQMANIVLDDGDATDLSATFPQLHATLTTSKALVHHYGLGRTASLSLNTTTLTEQLSNPAQHPPVSLSFDTLTASLENADTALRNFTAPQNISTTAPHVQPHFTLTVQNTHFNGAAGHGGIDLVSISSTAEKNQADSTFNAKGFHLALNKGKLPVPMNGAATTFSQTTHFSLTDNTATTNISFHIPDFVHFTALADTEQHFEHNPANNAPLRPLLKTLRLTLQGDRFVHALPILLSNGQTPSNDLVPSVRAFAQNVPLYAPAADYLTAPNGRTLTMTLTPPSPIRVPMPLDVLKNPAWLMLFLNPQAVSLSVQ